MAFNQPPYRHATHSASASATLKQAFATDPVIRYFIPSDGMYDGHGTELFGYFCWVSSESYDWMQVLCAEDGDGTEAVAVAVWGPPLAQESWAGLFRVMLTLARVWWLCGWATLKTIVAGTIAAEEKQKEMGCAGCDHLMYLATDPTRQGQGLGSRLLRAGIERADRRGNDCYLEATTPGNIGLYQRHGFEILAVHHVDGGDGPPITLMRRTCTAKPRT